MANAMRHLGDGKVMVHPPIQVMSQWVAHSVRQLLWLQGQPMPRVMDPLQLSMAWQQAWPNAEGRLSDTEKFLAARQAMAADRLLRQWFDATNEAWLDRNFFLARQAVERYQRERKLCTADDLLVLLCQQLEGTHEIPLPREISFLGFHEWTRLESRLLDALEQRGVTLNRPETGSGRQQAIATAVSAVAYDTTDEELHAAATWARARLEQRAQGSNDAPVAVIIEGLSQSSNQARRIFQQVFAAQNHDSAAAADAEPFHLPYAPPLLHHAAIQDALLLLRLVQQGMRTPIPFASLSRCLLSPHWGEAASERVARAQLELRLRKDGVASVSFASLFERARHLPAGEPPVLSLELLRAAIAVDWAPADSLDQALRLLRWPGPFAAGDNGSALMARFSSLLERARNLDGINAAERLQALQNLCLSQEQPGVGGALSPVQLLTPEDAAGGAFSAAWVAGLSASRWPGQPLGNPFLPTSAAQRIPRASAAGELAWCEAITASLKALAPEVIFSWPRQVDDVQQSPSPLISDVPVVTPESLPGLATGTAIDGPNNNWSSYADHPWLEAIEDGPGRPLAADEAIHGGAATLTDQSASPLAAYLKHRLNAQFEPMPEAFADAMWRGQLLHKALQALYQPALDQQQLPTPAGIPAAIEVAFQAMHAFNRLPSIQYRAEHQRLERLLQSWLEFDLQRPAFRVVALEQVLNLELLGHAIRLRVDRVDEVQDENGAKGLLIIDYKSSAGSLSAWARDRIGETQLPLYATVWRDDLPVAGLALAAVAYGKVGLNGVVASPSLQYDRIKPFQQNNSSQLHKRFESLPEAMDHWRASIMAIAGEFVGGDARNTVHDRNHYTVLDLAPLLRLQEGSEWLRQRGTRA